MYSLASSYYCHIFSRLSFDILIPQTSYKLAIISFVYLDECQDFFRFFPSAWELLQSRGRVMCRSSSWWKKFCRMNKTYCVCILYEISWQLSNKITALSIKWINVPVLVPSYMEKSVIKRNITEAIKISQFSSTIYKKEIIKKGNKKLYNPGLDALWRDISVILALVQPFLGGHLGDGTCQ